MVLPMDAKVVLMEHITYDCFHRELGGSTKLVIDVIRYDPPNVKVFTRYCQPCTQASENEAKDTVQSYMYICTLQNGNVARPEESVCIIATALA